MTSEKIREATKLLKNNIKEWREQFVKNCKELGNDVPFYKCDVGDVNALWKLKLDEGADAKLMEDLRFACIPRVFWNRAMIGFFLRQGCDVNAKDRDGNTALHLAVRFLWEMNHDVIQFLLDKGADPKIPDDEGRIPIFNLPPRFLTTNKPQSVKHFLRLLDDPLKTLRYTNGEYSLLHLAAENLDNSEWLKRLLDNFEGNVDVRSCKSAWETTPLMAAAARGKDDNCQLLIDKGADVNARDANGFTSLHIAVYRNTLKCLDSLMMKNPNADPNIRTNSGRDVYELACFYNRGFTKGAKPSKLIQIHELNGAIAILRERNYEEGLIQWKKAVDICAENYIKPSLELVWNYELAKEIKDYQKSDKINLDVYRAAIRTMDRISTGSSKLWNVLFAALYSKRFRSSDDELTEILSFISDKMETFNVENISAPMELTDILLFERFFAELYGTNFSSNIWLILKVTKFAIACFFQWMQRVGSKRIFYFFYVHYQMCIILIRNQAENDNGSKDWIAEEIRHLIKSIVELDLLHCYSGNSLLHYACENWNIELVEKIIDFGANAHAVNDDDQTPIQLIPSETFKDEQNVRVIKKMIDKGSPINVTNVDGKLIKDLLYRK